MLYIDPRGVRMGIALFFFVEKSVFEKQPSVDFPLLMEIYALLCRDRRLRTFLDIHQKKFAPQFSKRRGGGPRAF